MLRGRFLGACAILLLMQVPQGGAVSVGKISARYEQAFRSLRETASERLDEISDSISALEHQMTQVQSKSERAISSQINSLKSVIAESKNTSVDTFCIDTQEKDLFRTTELLPLLLDTCRNEVDIPLLFSFRDRLSSLLDTSLFGTASHSCVDWNSMDGESQTGFDSCMGAQILDMEVQIYSLQREYSELIGRTRSFYAVCVAKVGGRILERIERIIYETNICILAAD